MTWDAPLDAGDEITRYELQRRVGVGDPSPTSNPAHSGAGTSHDDSAPPDGTAHTYRVRAVTPIGATHWSPPASTAPGPPRLEAEVGSGRSDVDLVASRRHGHSRPWRATSISSTADGGDIWDPAWIDVPDDDPETRAFEVGGLTDGLRYGFEVRAVNASGPGAGSARATVVPGTRVRPGISPQRPASTV